jgi:SAM-dependent methyltransferase
VERTQGDDMALMTLEGIVENGQIRLRDDVALPEHTRIYVVVPELETTPQPHVYSPRLARPEQCRFEAGRRPMLPKPEHLGEEYALQFSDASVVAAYRYRPAYPAATFTILAGLIAAAPRLVLDAGCGRGDIARGLLPFVDRVDAVDVSAPMVDAGRLLPGGDDPRLRWIAGRVEEVDLAPSYALVTAGESLHWMDWEIVLRRFARILAPGGVLAIVGRYELPSPWTAALLAIIRRYSTNRAFQPYNLIDELVRRDLFTVQGQHETPPVAVRQSVAEYAESIHSRNGFSRDRMTRDQAAAFDEEVTGLLTPFAADGIVVFQVTARITYGRPAGRPAMASPRP